MFCTSVQSEFNSELNESLYVPVRWFVAEQWLQNCAPIENDSIISRSGVAAMSIMERIDHVMVSNRSHALTELQSLCVLTVSIVAS